MNTISIVEKTKDYVIIKLPRSLFQRISFVENGTLTEEKALKVLNAGMAEYRKRKTKVLTSLRDLRYGN